MRHRLPAGFQNGDGATHEGGHRGRARTYTDEQRAQALQVLGECGGNLSLAAKRLGIDVSLLCRWRQRAVTRAGAEAQARNDAAS